MIIYGWWWMTASSCFEVLIFFEFLLETGGAAHIYFVEVEWCALEGFFMSFERCTSRSPCGGMVSGAVLPDVCWIAWGGSWRRPCRNWNEEEAERQLFEFTGLLLSFSGVAPVPSLIWSRWSKVLDSKVKVECCRDWENTQAPSSSIIRTSHHRGTVQCISRMVLFKFSGFGRPLQCISEILATSFNSWPRNLASVVA